MKLGDAEFYANFILNRCSTPAHREYRQRVIAWLAERDEQLAADVRTLVATRWKDEA